MKRVVTELRREPRCARRAWMRQNTRVAIVGLLMGLLWVDAGRKMLVSVRASQLDFFYILRSSQNWVDGLPLYATQAGEAPNLNHPAFALALLPLTFLAPAQAFVVWTAISAASYLVGVLIIFRETRVYLTRRQRLFAVCGLLVFPGWLDCLRWGQVGALLAGPLVAASALLRRRRDVVAALSIGVVIALKPFLAPLLWIFVVRRQWSALSSAVLGALAISGGAAAIAGVGAFSAWFGVLRTVTWYADPWNLSLGGLIFRVARPSVPPPAVLWTVAAVMAIVGMLALRVTPRPTTTGPTRDMGLMLVCSLLGSPLGWLHYTPMLLPAFWALLEINRDRPFVTCLSVAGLLLLWSVYPGLILFPDALSRWAELAIHGAPTYGLVAIAGVLAIGEEADTRR